MDKRYQIFVSSAYEDLKEARQQVIETIIDMHHMPAAMEQFPASPEDQFSYIKRIIDDSDYYVLILGGKYGSIEPKSGKSYTELEYEYAKEKEVPVLAFFHEHPEKLPAEFYETDADKRAKLESFRKKVKNKLGKPWNNIHELPKKVMQSLNETVKSFERTGWVRGDTIASAELTAEQNTLLKERDSLKAQIQTLEIEKSGLSDILGSNPKILTEKVSLRPTVFYTTGNYRQTTLNISWLDIFLAFAPYIKKLGFPDERVRGNLNDNLCKNEGLATWEAIDLDDKDFYKIRLAFEAMGLITYRAKKSGEIARWRLTEKGSAILEEHE